MNSKLKDDLVVRYAIYLAAKKVDVSAPDNKLTDNEKALIEKEISNNPEVSEYLDFLQKSYTELYQDLGKSAFGDITLSGKHARERKFVRRFNSPLFRYPIVAAGILLLQTLLLVFISDISAPSYYSVIDEALDIKLSVTRNEPASSLSMGKALFNQSKYSEAIDRFKDEFQKSLNEGDQTGQELSAYYQGLTYLKQSKQSMFGLFPSYQSSMLDSSFKYLEISQPGLDNFPLLKKDFAWYLGMVEMLRYSDSRNEIHYTNAVRFLNDVVGQKTWRTEMALSLLKILSNMKEDGNGG